MRSWLLFVPAVHIEPLPLAFTNFGMSPRMAARFGLVIFLAAASCKAQSVVLFGDSLSDNGNGYAANAKFVLRTTGDFELISGCCMKVSRSWPDRCSCIP